MGLKKVVRRYRLIPNIKWLQTVNLKKMGRQGRGSRRPV